MRRGQAEASRDPAGRRYPSSRRLGAGGPPKKLVELDRNHHQIYNVEPYLTQAVEAEIVWYKKHPA